jgi:hypothetical protein
MTTPNMMDEYAANPVHFENTTRIISILLQDNKDLRCVIRQHEDKSMVIQQELKATQADAVYFERRTIELSASVEMRENRIAGMVVEKTSRGDTEYVDCFRKDLSATCDLLHDAVSTLQKAASPSESFCKDKEDELSQAREHIALLTQTNEKAVRQKEDILELYTAIKNSFGPPSNNYSRSMLHPAQDSASDIMRRLLVDKVSQIEKLREMVQ